MALPWRESAALTPPEASRAAGMTAATGAGTITREVMMAAALAIIYRDGADTLSARRLPDA